MAIVDDDAPAEPDVSGTPPAAPARRFRPGRIIPPSRRPRFGLRTRLTITYGVGALILAAVMSVVTFGLTRDYLLNQREDSAVKLAITNAGSIDSVVKEQDKPNALTKLPGGAYKVLRYDNAWYASSAVDFSNKSIPTDLTATVGRNQPARMRTTVQGTPYLVIGIPIASIPAEYYEAVPLRDLQTTLDGLALSLLGASALVTIAGGLLGFWAARRVFAPLMDVGRAAEAMAGGRLDTRLPVGGDPDLDLIAKPFNEMAEALGDRIDRDARFASEVSHELRSPLMTLSASLAVLENLAPDLPERARTALVLLSADVERLQQLVEDLLEISRFDVGAITLHLEEVLAAEMVIQAVSVLGGGGVPVRYDDDVSDVVVRVDKRRFGQVIANLLDNAQKYAGGATGITLTRVDDRVRIAVEDSGDGVPPDEREVIFDRFSRGRTSGSRAPDSGVGLGLALVDEHVRLHGGRVWVQDRPDGEPGACFVVELPIVPPAPDPDAPDEEDHP